MTKKIATRDAYGQELVRLGAENKDVVVLDADLSKSTKTHDFMKHYPDRFFNMGIAEANMMATAAGLAAVGKVPFASTFAVFATGRAFEQIRNSICYPRLNVKIAATHAGITVGEDGGSHQSVEDIAIMRALPGMTVFVPADAVETAAAVRAAAAIKGPVYIRLGRSGVPVLHGEDFEFIPGEAVTLRQGTDAAIMATGMMVAAALEAADTLAQRGISALVLDVHTIKPLDIVAVVEAARKCGAVVTAEEHSVIGGLGSAVAETLAEHCPVPLRRVGIKDTFGESGSPRELLQRYGLTADHIVEAVYKVLKMKGASDE
ncbi:transketolase family protein [Desulforamulus hydrothermalis]|uniref:Putative transketolase C-terminal section n=1 Tax=Desulforamulus hydrothermalis Lam5 = DSM 18033 TaxID=1121428 RepID=K8DY44_9FIRM|nr:transketolase family protein [Desulforamulus hydrothermalis]CCO07590.1 putative transketolase C-terminal section [Desulforamulus hydrothermalis Lam5 = DSM 18033]SHH20416.1 transketolase [Desulforamulus hydrothermalis Lam5 = DSM 18033]